MRGGAGESLAVGIYTSEEIISLFEVTMLKRFLSSDTAAVEVKTLTYRNSRILVLRDASLSALPFEVRIDYARQPIRFKSVEDAVNYAVSGIDASREALALEQAQAALA